MKEIFTLVIVTISLLGFAEERPRYPTEKVSRVLSFLESVKSHSATVHPRRLDGVSYQNGEHVTFWTESVQRDIEFIRKSVNAYRGRPLVSRTVELFLHIKDLEASLHHLSDALSELGHGSAADGAKIKQWLTENLTLQKELTSQRRDLEQSLGEILRAIR